MENQPSRQSTSKEFWDAVRARIAFYRSQPKNKHHKRFMPPEASKPMVGLNAPIAPYQPKKLVGVQEKNKRKKLMERQDGKCAYCFRPFSAALIATIDHVKPKSKGGTKGMANIVLACSPCNQLKGDLSTYKEAKERAERYLVFAELLKEKGYLE